MIREGRAHFYDGQSAQRHEVSISLSTDRQALELTGNGFEGPLRWPLAKLRAISDPSDREQLTLSLLAETEDETPRDPARLVATDPELIEIIIRTRPNLYRKEMHKGTWRKIGLFTGGACLATLVMLFVIIPSLAGMLAAIIPIEREVAFGKAITHQMERALGGTKADSLICRDPDGVAALETMLARLTKGQDLEYAVNIKVFDHHMVNAFAAPGGQVVIVKGLIDAASSPDEVAGVLAHEIGHVIARDPTRHSLRAAGSAGLLSMVLGDFAGGTLIALLGEHALSASYSRQAEARADQYAHDLLDAAGISTKGFAHFFESLDAEEHFQLPEYLSTHPVTTNRANAAHAFADNQTATKPVLNVSDWQALQRICD